MNKAIALLLPMLILDSNTMIAMNALKKKQEAIAKEKRSVPKPPQDTEVSAVDVNFKKWEAEAKNKCKNDPHWQKRAGFYGNLIAQWEYIFEQAKPIVEKLGKEIYDQMIKEYTANDSKWPEKYSDVVTNLQNKHSRYMDRLLELMPADLDISDLGGWESSVTSDLKKLTLYVGTTQKYMDLAREKTKWSESDIEKKVADEFDAWGKEKSFKTDEEKRKFLIQKAQTTLLSLLQGPHMFTGLSDKEKVVARAYATKALKLLELNGNKDANMIDFFTRNNPK